MHPFSNLMVPDGKIGIHWFGQSSFAIKKSDGILIQVDPYFPRNRPVEKYIHSEPPWTKPRCPPMS